MEIPTIYVFDQDFAPKNRRANFHLNLSNCLFATTAK